MRGWKTKLGLVIVAAGEAVRQLTQLDVFGAHGDVAEVGAKFLIAVGGILAAWGVAHKIDKGVGNG